MADRPERRRSKTGDSEVVDYHFRIELNVIANFDEKRLRQLIDAELARLKSAVVAKTR